MRALLVLLLLAGCTPRQECEWSCKGCCDVQGRCLPGTDPYACGGQGDCQACVVGQTCVPDAGCSGTAHDAVLQLTGNATFVSRSAQGFAWGSTGAPFIIVSNLDRNVCRDPGVPSSVDEEVLIVSARGQITPELERISFSDGGVVRTAVTGALTIRAQGARVRSTVNIDDPLLRLEGSIDAPFCGTFH